MCQGKAASKTPVIAPATVPSNPGNGPSAAHTASTPAAPPTPASSSVPTPGRERDGAAHLQSDGPPKLGQAGGESSTAGGQSSQPQQAGASAGLMAYSGMGDVGNGQGGSDAFGAGSTASGSAGDALGSIGGEFGNFVFDGSALDQYFLPDASGDGSGPSDGSGVGGGGNGFGVDDWGSFSVFGDQ